jgi:hypothetical protein
LQCICQRCDEPAGLISAYFTLSTNNGSGVGIEGGMLDPSSPIGLFLGCTYIIERDNKEMTELAFRQNEFPVFYLKAVCRVLRIENKISAFIVASPQLGFQSKFDFRPGVKLFAPLSERVAIEFEPLYSLKQIHFQFNFHIAYVL